MSRFPPPNPQDVWTDTPPSSSPSVGRQLALLLVAVTVLIGCQPQDPPVHERVSVQLFHYAPDADCDDVYCSSSIDTRTGRATDNRSAGSTVGDVSPDAASDLYDALVTLPSDGECPTNDEAPWQLEYAVYPPPSIAERADLAVFTTPWCQLDQPTLDQLRPLWEAAGGWWPAP